MNLISHRGNINSRDVDKENNPAYIIQALSSGYDVEIDVWFNNDVFMLGHDHPQYKIQYDFLLYEGLWLHCKTIETLSKLVYVEELNCFFHDTDAAVLTSKNYIWTYPGNKLYSNSICVLPETTLQDIKGAAGVCSDFISNYK